MNCITGSRLVDTAKGSMDVVQGAKGQSDPMSHSALIPAQVCAAQTEIGVSCKEGLLLLDRYSSQGKHAWL